MKFYESIPKKYQQQQQQRQPSLNSNITTYGMNVDIHVETIDLAVNRNGVAVKTTGVLEDETRDWEEVGRRIYYLLDSEAVGREKQYDAA